MNVVGSLRFGVLIVLSSLMVGCAEEPFGDVATVLDKQGHGGNGRMVFGINESAKNHAKYYGYTVYASLSVHALGSDEVNCAEVPISKLSRDRAGDEAKLYELGWVPVYDSGSVFYRKSGGELVVGLGGSSIETRCKLDAPGESVRIHVHFIGDSMPFGASGEEMFGLDMVVPFVKENG